MRFLGRGGNARVWKVTKEGQVGAIKLPYARTAVSEPYQRFCTEVALQRELDVAGLLPVLDAFVPESPTTEAVPYMVTPCCVSLRNFLSANGQGLDACVEAVAELAETLQELHDRGISHRDVKPENLYRYNDRATLGDLGLVSLSGPSSLTRGARVLGPVHYIAPEMTTGPENADGAPADVFSLAKTLWVLATHQQYPPPGQLRLEDTSARLSTWVVDPRAVLLDGLIEACTIFDPSRRPTMAMFAQSLRDWLQDFTVRSASSEVSPLEGIALRLAAAQEATKRQKAASNTHIEHVRAAFQRFSAAAVSVESALRTQGVNLATGNYEGSTGFFPEELSRVPITVHLSTRHTVTGGLILSAVPPHMIISIGVSGDSNGTGRLGYKIDVLGDPNTRMGFRVALLGTPSEEHAISELILEVHAALPDALELLFVNHHTGPTPKRHPTEDQSIVNLPPNW